MYITFTEANRGECPTSEEAFIAYLEIKKTEDDNWKFWTSFVMEDNLPSFHKSLFSSTW